MSEHNITHANSVYMGNAYSPKRYLRGAKLSPVSVWDMGVVETGTDTDIDTGIAVDLKLNSSIVNTTVSVPRTIKISSSDAGDTMIATIKGTNAAGYMVTESVTLAGTTAVETTKCFSMISTIEFDSAPAGSFSLGSGDKLQFSQAVSGKWQVISIHADDTLDAAVITVADQNADQLGYFELAAPPAGRSVVVIQVADKTDTLSLFGAS